MANLGGKISLDISEFQQKITEANRLIRANESAWMASAAQMDDWTKSEAGLKSRIDSFNTQIDAQKSIIDTLTQKREKLVEIYGEESREVDKVNYQIIQYSNGLERMRKQQASAEAALEKLTNEQDDNRVSLNKQTDASEKAEKQTKDLSTAIVTCKDSFSVLKATVANLASTAISSLIRSLKQVVNMVNTLPDSTRTLRRQLIQLETAFADAGYAAEAAHDAYTDYNAVMGTVDSNATTTISLLATLSSSQKDLSTWTETLAGVYAKMGVAIPTNELTKNIQQTANSKKMTENLTKVLQAAGVDVDDVTEKLTSLNTVEERNEYLMTLLNKHYGDLGKKYIENNASIIESEKATSRLNIAVSKFGGALEPLKTKVSNCAADILESLSSLAAGEEGAAEELAYNIGYLVGTIGALWDDVYTTIEPYLGMIKQSIQNWFDENKDALLDKFETWLKSIFGEDAVETVKKLADKIVEPIKTLFQKIAAGDYEGALGASLPVITLGIGLSLLKSAASDIPAAISSALGTAFTSKSLTMAGAVAGLVGVISLGIQLKDAMETGDYKAWAEKALQSILDGLAVFGVTGSLTMGAFAFALSSTLDISAVEFAEGVKDKLGLSDVVMSVIPVLSTAALTGIKTSLSDGIAAGMGKAWKSAGIASAVLGIVDIGLEFKDAMETGDYATVCKNMVDALLAGFAVAGITGSFSAGAIAFNLVAQLDIKIVDIASKIKEELNLSNTQVEIGLTLAAGAASGIISALKSGFATALSAAWKTSGITAGIMGAIDIGIQVKDAMATGDYESLVANIAAGLIAGAAAGVITGNPAVGMMAFNIAIQFHFGEHVWDTLKEGFKDAEENISEFWEIVKAGGIRNLEVEVDKTVISPKAVELATDENALKNATIEVSQILNHPLVLSSYKAQLKKLLSEANKGGAEIATELAAGYGIGIEDLSKLSEKEAKQIIVAVKDVLDIHSPSGEGIEIGEMFKLGVADGYAGLPNRLAETTEEAVDAVTGVIDDSAPKVESAWSKIWKGIKAGAEIAGDALSGLRDAITEVLNEYDAEEGAASIYDSLFAQGTDALAAAGPWGALAAAILNVVKMAMESEENAGTFLEDLANDIIDGAMKLLDDLPQIVKLALKFIKELVKGLIKALPELMKQIPYIVADIIKEFLNMLPEFIELGWELMKGLGQGIWEGIKSIGQVIWDAGEAVVGWFKDIFGIASPSKVMKAEIGRNIALGVAEGINENIPMINSAIDGINTRLDFSAGGTNGKTSSKIINVNQYNTYSRSHSAYELYKSERAIRQMVGAY